MEIPVEYREWLEKKILAALSWGGWAPARKGGLYIKGSRYDFDSRSVIVVNLSPDEAEGLRGRVRAVRVLSAKFLPKVILVSVEVEVGEKKEEPEEVKSGLSEDELELLASKCAEAIRILSGDIEIQFERRRKIEALRVELRRAEVETLERRAVRCRRCGSLMGKDLSLIHI